MTDRIDATCTPAIDCQTAKGFRRDDQDILSLFLASAGRADRGRHLVFAFRLNYVCGPDEHLIRYKVDGIARAEKRMFKAHYLPHDTPGYVDEKPYIADFSQPECCHAEKTVAWDGFILWGVTLEGETIGEPKKRRVSAYIALSNCGSVFVDNSYISAEPIR